MRRIAALALSLGLTLGLAACSGGGDAASTPAPDAETTPSQAAETSESTEKDTLVVVTGGGTFNPYSYTDEETGELKGFEADMWNELSSRLSDRYDVTIESTTFDAIWGMLDSGRADVAACFFGVNDERLEKYNASIPYAGDPIAVGVLADSGITALADLSGKTVGVAAGSAALDELESRAEELGCTVQPYETFTEVMQDLSLGRIDACANDIIAIHTYNTTGADISILDERLTQSQTAYFVRKDDASAAKLEDINEALQSMLDDGTVAEYCVTWFGDDLTVNR